MYLQFFLISEVPDHNTNYIPLEKPKEPKFRNPLDTSGKKNPFVYDSSESEDEEVDKETKQNIQPAEAKTETTTETKAVWRENLFFSNLDSRLQGITNKYLFGQRKRFKNLNF